MPEEEPKEGTPEEPSVSQEDAQEFVDSISDEKRELMQDREFLALVVGRRLFASESLRLASEDPDRKDEEKELFGEGFFREGHEKEERCAAFFVDLLKGTSLVDAVQRYGVESTSWVIHHTGNTGVMLLLDRKGTSNQFQGYNLGTISAGVEYSSDKGVETAKRIGEDDMIIKSEVIRKSQLERARKLEQELGIR